MRLGLKPLVPRSYSILFLGILLLNSLCCSVSIPTAVGETNSSKIYPIVSNYPSEEALDIIFVPANYSLGQMETFRQTVESYYTALLSKSPFSNYSQDINIWRAEVIEDFQLNRSSTMSRLLFVNNVKVIQTIAGLGTFDFRSRYPHDVAIVLANTQTYGGSGFKDVPVSYTGSKGIQVMMHELGHSLGNLADEYVVFNEDYPANKEITNPNVDWNGSKWQNISDTGAFLGANYRNLVRPTLNSCIMRNPNYFEYCPVCTIALENILKEFSTHTNTPVTLPSTNNTKDQSSRLISTGLSWIVVLSVMISLPFIAVILWIRKTFQRRKYKTGRC